MAHISGFLIGALLGRTSLQEKEILEAEFERYSRDLVMSPGTNVHGEQR